LRKRSDGVKVCFSWRDEVRCRYWAAIRVSTIVEHFRKQS